LAIANEFHEEILKLKIGLNEERTLVFEQR